REPWKLHGWIGVDSSLRLVGEVRNGVSVEIAYAGKVRHPAVCTAGQDGRDSFAFERPAGVWGPITARGGDRQLLGSHLAWPPEFRLSGWVMLENKALVGNARLNWAPTLPMEIVVTPRGAGHTQAPIASVAVESTGL